MVPPTPSIRPGRCIASEDTRINRPSAESPPMKGTSRRAPVPWGRISSTALRIARRGNHLTQKVLDLCRGTPARELRCAWQESNLLPFGPEKCERSPRPSPYHPVDPVSYSDIRGDRPLPTPHDPAGPRTFVTIQVTKGHHRSQVWSGKNDVSRMSDGPTMKGLSQ